LVAQVEYRWQEREMRKIGVVIGVIIVKDVFFVIFAYHDVICVIVRRPDHRVHNHEIWSITSQLRYLSEVDIVSRSTAKRESNKPGETSEWFVGPE
jgi:hypothetical protein